MTFPDRASDLSAATLSAITVPVPEVEPVVGRHRRMLDRSAGWGVPAHVTVLYPFVPPVEIDAGTVDPLGAALGGVPAFNCAFTRVRWFGDETAWLQPEPDAGFRALTQAVVRHFPDHPPYRGAYEEPIPHLTIGDHSHRTALAAAAVDVEAELPVPARIRHVHLMAGSAAANSWWTVAVFTLPDPPPAAPARPAAS